MQMKTYWTKRTTGRLLIRSHCAAYLVILLCGRECGRMSRGQSQMRTCSAKTSLGRCNNRSHDSTNIFDVDISKLDVIIIDSPESSNRKSRCSKNANRKHFPTVICIEENDDDNDDDIRFRRVDHYATSSKTFHPSSSNSSAFEEFDGDECQVLNRKGKGRKRYSKRIFDTLSSDCSTSKIDTSKRGISDTGDTEGDCSDCEIMDGSSVNIREEWEKAALKKKMERSHSPSKEGLSAFQSHNKPGIPVSETAQKKDDFLSTSGCRHAVPNNEKVHSDATMSTNGKEDPPHDGFTEESLFNFKKYSADDLNHGLGEDIHRRHSSQNKNESLSESLHRAQPQSEFSFDHKLKSNCGRDAPAPRSFSSDAWMQHDLHGQSDNTSSTHKEGVNESAPLFTAGIPDKQLDGYVLRHGSSSPCTIPCPSQHVPEPKSRKNSDVSEDASSFHSQTESASSEQNISLGGMHTELHSVRSFGEEEAVSQSPIGNSIQEDINLGTVEGSSLENVNVMSDTQNNIISELEKHKESKEYRLAEEEEWASRRQQLQIQAEEIQRLRKRKKAENLRLLEMEKRQKQRLEEMRESQKRDEEAINLKDQLRAEIRKELEKLEMKYRDMASLLRGLGVHVSGGPYPMPYEVNAAYRRALLRFHPDRASRTDIRQQVEAEEKFKLISRLKEKLLLLLPVAY